MLIPVRCFTCGKVFIFLQHATIYRTTQWNMRIGPQQIHFGSAKLDPINESFHPRRAIYNMLGWFYVLLFKCKKSYHFLLYLSMDRPFLMLKSVNWTPWSSLLPNVLLSSFTIAINVHWSHSGYLKMASHEFNKIRRLIDFS